MNDIQKERIKQMKTQGESYSKISITLGIPISTIKSFCCRNQLCSEVALHSSLKKDTCRQCGKELKHIVGHKQKKYCSDRCRMTYWNTHQEEVKRKAIYDFVCPVCGRRFESYGNSKRIYCSLVCFGKARRHLGD